MIARPFSKGRPARRRREQNATATGRRQLENARLAGENARLIERLAERFPDTSVACAVCPPHVYLSEVGRMLLAAELPIALGAQDVSAELQGALPAKSR